VVAVELHPGRAAALRERFGGRHPEQVRVVEADVLGMYLPDRPFRVVASPPYAVATPLLRLLLGARSGLVSAHLVLPVAVIRRAVGQAGRQAGRRWSISAGRSLPRNAFRPPPRVDSAVLEVHRR
jgi:23S rRNA (adenine-N6)-dimethyltransferase